MIISDSVRELLVDTQYLVNAPESQTVDVHVLLGLGRPLEEAGANSGWLARRSAWASPAERKLSRGLRYHPGGPSSDAENEDDGGCGTEEPSPFAHRLPLPQPSQKRHHHHYHQQQQQQQQQQRQGCGPGGGGPATQCSGDSLTPPRGRQGWCAASARALAAGQQARQRLSVDPEAAADKARQQLEESEAPTIPQPQGRRRTAARVQASAPWPAEDACGEAACSAGGGGGQPAAGDSPVWAGQARQRGLHGASPLVSSQATPLSRPLSPLSSGALGSVSPLSCGRARSQAASGRIDSGGGHAGSRPAPSPRNGSADGGAQRQRRRRRQGEEEEHEEEEEEGGADAAPRTRRCLLGDLQPGSASAPACITAAAAIAAITSSCPLGGAEPCAPGRRRSGGGAARCAHPEGGGHPLRPAQSAAESSAPGAQQVTGAGGRRWRCALHGGEAVRGAGRAAARGPVKPALMMPAVAAAECAEREPQQRPAQWHGFGQQQQEEEEEEQQQQPVEQHQQQQQQKQKQQGGSSGALAAVAEPQWGAWHQRRKAPHMKEGSIAFLWARAAATKQRPGRQG